MHKNLRKKKCKGCMEWYQPKRPLQVVCEKYGYKCAIRVGEIKKAKKEAVELRKSKADLKPLSHWLKETQVVFNEYIRLRDSKEGCISCGAIDSNKWDAGHYRTVGSAPQLRFNEDNVHKQCSWYCNVNKSGNIEKYRPRLIDKIGENRVLDLELNNELVRFSREELDDLRKSYRLKIKQLKGDQDG